MKTAKSYKIILLTILCIVTLLAGVMFVNTTNAHAEAGSQNTSSYFSGSNSSEIKFEDDKVTATIKSEDTFSFKWNIVCNDTEIKFAVDDKVTTLSLTFKVESPIDGEDDLEKELVIKFGDTNMEVSYDEGDYLLTNSRDILLKTTVESKVLKVFVNGEQVSNDEESLVKNAGLSPMKNVAFNFTTDQDVDGKFTLEYVDQKASDATGDYKQTFELNDENKVATLAKPRATITESMYLSDGSISIRDGKQYTVTITSYSLTATSDYTKMYIDTNNAGSNNSNIWFANATLPKSFVVSLAKDVTVDSTVELCIKSTVEDFGVVEVLPIVVRSEYTDAVPTYNFNESAREAYLEAIEKATQVEYEDGVGDIRLGDDFSIPSLRDLVNETVTSYDQMTTTVYYWTPSNDINSTSSLSFSLDTAGDYKFFVIFADEFGNKLTKDDFFTVDEEDENKITFTELGQKYIFTFHIEDTAPLSVTSAEEQGAGFIGTEYNATEFEITAYNYSTTYTLYYNENADADANDDGWKEIIKSSALTDSYDNDYFTSDDIKAIAYDGELAFTPNKIGAYKITCDISSSHTSRTASASTIIKVEKEATTLESDSNWLGENIWSVVFLSVGTLCLIGIIILLFVKPKQKETEVE